MKSKNEPNSFRGFVPFVMNRKVYSYMFDPEKEEVLIRIPMRRYTNKTVWEAVYVDVKFMRRSRRFVKKVEDEVTSEVYYTALCRDVTFEDGDSLSPIPVIK